MLDPKTQFEQDVAQGRRCPRCGSDEREDRRVVTIANKATLSDKELDAEKCDHEWHDAYDDDEGYEDDESEDVDDPEGGDD